MKQKVVIYWSRRDLRTEDNPALTEALKYARKERVPFLPLFILEPYMTAADPAFQFGLPSRYFLSEALPRFAKNFKSFLIPHTQAARFFITFSKIHDLVIYVNEDVHPDFYAQLRKLVKHKIEVKLYRDQLTISKDTKTGSGNTYSVFTPFKKAVWQEFVNAKVLKKPSFEGIVFFSHRHIKDVSLVQAKTEILQKTFSKKESIHIHGTTIDLGELSLPEKNYILPYTTEKEAVAHFKRYMTHELSFYKDKRDSLELDATSHMSIALAWGLVSSRMLVRDVRHYFDDSFDNVDSIKSNQGVMHFISELIWREFYKYLFYHHPYLFNTEFQEKFRHTKWLPKKEALERFKLWMQGKTGYTIVDAAMMQLAKSGVMHNRARMIVASVLTKNFGVDWRWGQEYFRAMLLDLDEASNNGGWQWGASVGADPKPIRIFNPYLQAENYDPKGVYQKKWLSDEYLQNTPPLIIDHALAREDALKRYGLAKDIKVRDY